MERIKTIYTFGSSFTAGGGFEFDSERHNDIFPELYSQLNEEQTPFNFSWPGQLQKLLGDSIKVINLAKSGFGNQRTERLIYEIVNSKKFKKNESLFLIEFTALGRDEFFSKELNDYIVSNYQNIDKNTFEFYAIAKDYFYQSESDEEYLDQYNNLFNTFVTKFKSVNDEMDKLSRSIDFLISYLESKSINYLLTSPNGSYYGYDKTKSFEFGDGDYFLKSDCFVDFSVINKMNIKYETYGLSEDMHLGFKANKLVANIIFNKLVESKLIDFDKKEIDWKYYKELKVIKKIL
jgi:hypothetical protein